MGVPFLILLAFVWALFGLWGYLRGWRVGLLAAGLILGALLVLSLAPARLTRFVGIFNKGIGLFTGSDQPFIDTAPANLALILLIGGTLVSLLLGMLKVLRSKPSFRGFLLGIFDGYLFSAYMLAALVPGRAILPLPVKIEGLAKVSLQTAVTAPPNTGLIAEINAGLQQAVKLSFAPTAILIFIIGFILLIMLTGSRGGKKG